MVAAPFRAHCASSSVTSSAAVSPLVPATPPRTTASRWTMSVAELIRSTAVGSSPTLAASARPARPCDLDCPAQDLSPATQRPTPASNGSAKYIAGTRPFGGRTSRGSVRREEWGPWTSGHARPRRPATAGQRP
ncbi:MAG: hypothetical protein AVDCRST_MAG73-1214 [uncultured Thermomicrobiales bacterium]|uniref:Uncharacterized protein n=1 Tax=uncultured Thermomicrobiales bacterium TaxID=1645740 RepID=A0A6J4TY78_9BACT|nr:MAG: hypothetical protein AVDCRST_MAG73-1214 [uncultured Thermomicrobiales bacterium]